MSNKLNQSLDDILKAGRQATRRSNRPRPAAGAKASGRPTAPVGGVKKVTKPVRTAKVPAVSVDGESKVLVSSLVSQPLRTP
jgi:THO complex subunit 4